MIAAESAVENNVIFWTKVRGPFCLVQSFLYIFRDWWLLDRIISVAAITQKWA